MRSPRRAGGFFSKAQKVAARKRKKAKRLSEAAAKGESGVDLSEYQGMWLFAMFDLPVKTRSERRRYTQFRKLLLKEGFSMLQFSVYARYFGCEEASQSHRQCIRHSLPSDGQVRLLAVTDKQFGKMESYFGKRQGQTEKPPEQLLLL